MKVPHNEFREKLLQLGACGGIDGHVQSIERPGESGAEDCGIAWLARGDGPGGTRGVWVGRPCGAAVLSCDRGGPGCCRAILGGCDRAIVCVERAESGGGEGGVGAVEKSIKPLDEKEKRPADRIITRSCSKNHAFEPPYCIRTGNRVMPCDKSTFGCCR